MPEPPAHDGAGLSELRQGLGASLPTTVQRELQSLQAESDPELQGQGLLHLAARLENQGSEAAVLEVLRFIQEHPGLPRAQRDQARERQAALTGQGGSFGARGEVLLRRFAGEVTNPSALLAMTAAGLAFRVTRLGIMARLAASPGSALSRGRLATALASTGAFFVEAPTFTLAHRAADSALGRQLEWSREALSRELASSVISLGAMRTVGAAPALIRGAGASKRPFAGAVSLYGGILLGHGIEMRLGLRPTQSAGDFLLDSAATFLHFQAAGRLSRLLLGRNGSRWESQMELQSRSLADSMTTAPASLLAAPLRPALAVGLEPALPETLKMSSTFEPRLRLVDGLPRIGENSGPPSLPPEKLRPLPRGGVMARTSAGWIQFGVPMWTNKDAFEIFVNADGFRLRPEQIREHLPTTFIFDLDYVPRHTGLLPADFMQYMYFINRGIESRLVTPDAATAWRLQEFLDLSYQGPRTSTLSEQVRAEYPSGAAGLPLMGEEIVRGFPAAEPEAMRRVLHLNQAGEFLDGEVRVLKLGPLRYEIFESGVSQGLVDLGQHPLPAPSAEALHGPELARARRKVLTEGRPALWPIGTGHGFTPREETSGFLIWNRGRAVAVDPPSSTLEFLQRHRLPLTALEGILLTHGHTDHYGNAVPQLLQARPDLRIYTTPTIFRMLRRQYELAVGGHLGGNFVPLYPQIFTELVGLPLRPEYSFHPVPALGFEIYDRKDTQHGRLVFSFTGDTFADQVEIWRHTQPGPDSAPPVMTVSRANQVLRHGALLLASKGQHPPPIFLIEGGVPPIHINPLRTRDLLDQAEALGVDTSRVRVYHIAGEKAAEARVPKWAAGVEGFFDLSGYFRKR